MARKEIEEFAQAMESELKENDYKGGWKDCDLTFLLSKLDEEVKELKEAIQVKQEFINLNSNARSVGECQYDYSLKSSNKNILSEAADVGNIAMMIADVCKAL